MTNRHTRNRLLVTGVSLLVVFALGPALTGLASAAPAPTTATGAASAEWAYGGLNGSSGTYPAANGSYTWSASIGIVVIFNATNTSAHTVEISAERTIAVSLFISASVNNTSDTFDLNELEVDTAHANLTNASTVYVGGTPTPALGIDNASARAEASITESLAISDALGTNLLTRHFNASGEAQASVQFAPSLGLIPLNLTGVSSWTSSATATPSAAWTVGYAWVQDLLGVPSNRSDSVSGHWDTTTTVSLTGSASTVGLPHFDDHRSRTAVVLLISGHVDLYDGFVLIPAGFDFFGGGSHIYDNYSIAAAALHPEVLYVSAGTIDARAFSSAGANFGESSSGSIGLAAAPAASPAAAPSPTGQVVAQPESPASAQAQAACLQYGCSPAPSSWFSGVVAVGLILLVVGVAGSVGVFEWRLRSRGRSPPTLAGMTGGSGSSGAPPGAAASPPVGAPAHRPPSPGGPGSGL